MHRMTPNWNWTLKSQKYFIYTKYFNSQEYLVCTKHLPITFVNHVDKYLEIQGVKDVLFGKLEETPVLNLEIVCGKYFIYLCKLKSEIPQVKKYLVYRPPIELID